MRWIEAEEMLAQIEDLDNDEPDLYNPDSIMPTIDFAEVLHHQDKIEESNSIEKWIKQTIWKPMFGFSRFDSLIEKLAASCMRQGRTRETLEFQTQVIVINTGLFRATDFLTLTSVCSLASMYERLAQWNMLRLLLTSALQET